MEDADVNVHGVASVQRQRSPTEGALERHVFFRVVNLKLLTPVPPTGIRTPMAALIQRRGATFARQLCGESLLQLYANGLDFVIERVLVLEHGGAEREG